ncbi:MAG: GxxExxY protein [Algoriphagus sp.]|uniref:GxxExxY protein n=1 Tax=Algoriphagus sp. TaxID=1872435 RepID=UPI002618FA09|nr:GxxExxY protein [Algoriphagus sp.]MDG1275899.1 GxxExxY protein [Algoriphagus sp.]
MNENETTSKIIGAAIEVHKQLGPGLLESAYEFCLAHELRTQNLKVETQVILPVVFKGIKLEAGYRLDLLVEDRIIVEIKAVEELANIHLAQTLTYLRLGGFRLGLLINFNVPKLVDGLKRVVND